MSEQATLTERQREIYDFICARIEERGYGPTVREIGLAFEIRSPNGVMCHLKALEKKGLINRQGNQARAMTPVGFKRGGSSSLPLLGTVAAGAPIAGEAQEDRLDFSELFCGNNNFALRVRGQSMIEDHIDDGDFVVIKPSEVARNGERVVAMIDQEMTLKRFQLDRGQVVLHPANGTMAPIRVDPESDVRVLGVLVGVLRRC